MNHLARIGLLLVGTAMLSPALPASAADYDPPIVVDQADEYVPVEVGSGWYLRGDVAYNVSRDFKDSKRFADDFVIDDSFISDLGWIGPVDMFGFGEKQSVASASVGFGYHINDFLRADVNIGILGTEKYSASGQIWSGRGDTLFADWSALTAQPDYGCLGSRTRTVDVTTTTPQPDIITPQPPTITTTIDPITGAVTTVTTPQPDLVTPQPPVVNSSTNSATDPFWRRDCALSAQASNHMYDGTANFYVDLGTFAGITPYVGAGAGLLYSRNKASASARCANGSVNTVSTTGGPLPDAAQTRTERETTFTCADTEEHEFFSYDKATYNLMYSLTAGVAYKISQNASLDLGYTFKSAPDMEYYTVSETDIERRKGYDVHQVRVGLRYDLW